MASRRSAFPAFTATSASLMMSQPWFALATNAADVTFITNGPWKTFDLVVGIT
ncbi:hypothetical protein [Brevibacterium daeguense]|uniref:hypothetical protein n=1 Tax=Brevibacterium daeguense TaxID=909936 RepID=UPI001F3D6DE4|nr:hypothetical protein [Brevibacterium daeguense]